MEEEINDKEIEVKQINISDEASRKHFMEEIRFYQFIDLGILDAYNKMPEEFRQKLSFETFYKHYRKKIQVDLDRADSEEYVDDLLSNSNEETEVEIKEEDLCIKCKKERKQYDDPDYCPKCISELKSESEERTQQLQNELIKDEEFKKLSSETKRKVYVQQKYTDEKKKNKFIFLPKLAKESYALVDMNKK